MQTVAIICEYNPFHLGHKVQIEAIRSQFDREEVCIVSLMSGCYVQRGGMAVLSPATRTEIALEMGADIVLELPFPWSMSGADYFASGAISILEAVGGIDYLCFGSECGQLERLSLEADRLNAPDYCSALDRAASELPTHAWAAVRESAYRATYSEELPHYAPNDLLAIAYLMHLRSIKPMPIERKSGYSASSARKSFAERDFGQLAQLVPPQTFFALQAKNEAVEGLASADVALLSSLRLMTASELASCAEGSIELAGLILRHLPHCRTIDSLVASCTNKKYTSARVRRVLWHIFLRTPADLPASIPAYTRLLGCNEMGRRWLSERRKSTQIPVITRISNVRNHPNAEEQFIMNEKRHELYAFLSGTTEKSLPIVK